MTKVLSVLVVILTLAVGTILSPIFRIKNIDIPEKGCLPPDEVKTDILAKKPNIIFFRAKDAENKILKTYSCITYVKLQKIFPSTVKIDFQSENPLATIDGTNLALTSAKKIIEHRENNLPKIFGASQENPPKGSDLKDPQLSFVIDALIDLHNSDFIVNSIRIISPDNIVVYNQNDAIAIFSANLDLEKQLNSLQQVLTKSRIDATKIRKVDLRFDKPVVAFK